MYLNANEETKGQMLAHPDF